MTNKTNGQESVAADQAVANCFESLLVAIGAVADDWRLRAAEANLDRDDARAQECQAAVQSLRETAGEVEAILLKWSDKWPAQIAAPAPAPGAAGEHTPATKSPRSNLRVQVNSKVIECSTAAETFARTIEHFGLERVAQLGRASCGIALIGKSKTTSYPSQFPIGGYYVCTNINNLAKKRLLEEIASELNVPLCVEIT